LARLCCGDPFLPIRGFFVNHFQLA
jgi:hypothetical protein